MKLRDTCNYRGSLCYRFPRGKTAGRSLRPCQPRFCSREIPKTVREAVLAGFSESGLEVVVDPRAKPITEREVRGSTCLLVVLPRRRSPRRLGERRLASFHSALRLCRCLERNRPFSLDPVRLDLCSLSSRDVGLRGRGAMYRGRRQVELAAVRPPASSWRSSAACQVLNATRLPGPSPWPDGLCPEAPRGNRQQRYKLRAPLSPQTTVFTA